MESRETNTEGAAEKFYRESVIDPPCLQRKLAYLPQRSDFSAERALSAAGAKYVCGVDEVGRGPIAGPVVVAAVILDADNLPQDLRDSKQLSPAKRACAADNILARALAVSYAALPAETIDTINIRAATLQAMRMAVAGLALKPDYALVDGRDIPPDLSCPAFALIKGDARSLSIAAASILAKTLRDTMMRRAGKIYPAYGLEQHCGYGTPQHHAALSEHGIIGGLHRASFAPVKDLLKQNG